jgi:TonB family protein
LNVLLLIAALVLPSMTPQFGPVPVGSVSGQLRSKNGLSISGVRISAMAIPEPGVPITSASTLVSIAVTDSAGRYRLENVPVGRYYIVAGLVDQPTYYPGVSSLTGATAVTITANLALTDINFEMVIPVGLSIRGKVIRPAGAPTTGIQRVSVFGSVSGTLSSPIAADGSFEITNVRPGQYSLSVSSGQLTLAQPVTFTVTDKDVTGIEAVMMQTLLLTGNLMVEGDGLRPRLQLTLSPFKGGISSPYVGIVADGSFRVTVPEGEYRLSWSNLPSGYFLKSITMGSVDLLSAPLKVQVNTPVQPISIMLGVSSPPPWTKLGGRVVGLNPALTGTPIHVSLTGTSLVETLDTIIAPDGTFEIGRVLPGNYTIRFPALPVAAINLIVPGGGSSSIDIPVPSLKQFSGRFTIEGQSQISPRLTFSWPEQASSLNSGASFTSTNASAAAVHPDGTFTVILPEGERKLTLSAPLFSIQALTYGATDLLKQPFKTSASNSDELLVTLAPIATATATSLGPPPAYVVGGVVGGVAGGVPGGVIGGTFVNGPPPPQPRVLTATAVLGPPSQTTPDTITVAEPVALDNLVTKVIPTYPAEARAARVQGAVKMAIVISKEGNVESVTVTSGDPQLRDSAVAAVKQWKYKPVVVNGQPVRVQSTVTLNFALQ